MEKKWSIHQSSLRYIDESLSFAKLGLKAALSPPWLTNDPLISRNLSIYTPFGHLEPVLGAD